MSSAAFKGRTCPLEEIGHARDGARGRLQIVYAVLATTAGIPVAVEGPGAVHHHRGGLFPDRRGEAVVPD